MWVAIWGPHKLTYSLNRRNKMVTTYTWDLFKDPFFIGFNSMVDRLNSVHTTASHQSYPPYNIVKVEDDIFRVDLALAGFDKKDVDVPCEYRIFCNGTKWIHELHICHFQVACSGTYTEGDCEGCIQNPNDPCCLVDNHGYRCAGAVARWETPLADLTGAPAVSNITWCLGGSEYCQPYEVGYADAFDAYNNFLTSNGGRQAWGIYLTDECSEQDPFLPCDPAYNMTAAGQILFGSAPYSFDGSWCSGFLEDYDIGCARWYRDFDIIHGTFV